MNTPLDKLLSALKIASPYSTIEEKAKEVTKQYIKNHNYAPIHENSLIAIVENAQNIEEMQTKLIEYTQAFNLNF